MKNSQKVLKRILAGAKNIRFEEMISLVEAFGFRLLRVKGSHHIFTHDGLDKLLNLQEADGEAKPYQIKQFLTLVEKHNLQMEKNL